MSTTNYYSYRWYNEGRYLAILQENLDLAYTPYIDRGHGIYVTPTVSDTSAIYLRYSVAITGPTNEEDDINVSGPLLRAIEYYVRAKLAEDRDDMRMYRHFKNKFYQYLERKVRNKMGTEARVVMPRGVSVLR